CVPPWDEDELACKVENAARYAQNEAGAWAAGSSEEAFGSVLDTLDLDDPEEEPAARPQRERFKLWTPGELRKRPPPSWLIPDLFPAEGVSVLFGPPGSLKSYLAIRWAAELAALGIGVVYVAGEGANGIAQRLFAWQQANGVGDDLPLWIMDEAPWAADDKAKLAFCKKLETVKPQLVILDTLARSAVGLNENDAKDMGLMISFLDAIKVKLRTAVLVVHHTGKEEGRGMRGSNALEGAVDAAFQVTRNKGLRAVSVRCTRQKDAPEREEPWCFEGRDIGGQMVLQPVTFKEYSDLTKVQDTLQPVEIGRILRELSAVGVENGVSTNVLAYDMVNRANPELTEEARETLVKRQEKVLAKLSRTRLEAYCTGVGPSLLWFLP
ncbi:MAG TPA: AAA family ATPase, partial [Ktedonobacterales bacterium]|nr:AAA family ATPase [Ktedonobacterales bacterium]